MCRFLEPVGWRIKTAIFRIHSETRESRTKQKLPPPHADKGTEERARARTALTP